MDIWVLYKSLTSSEDFVCCGVFCSVGSSQTASTMASKQAEAVSSQPARSKHLNASTDEAPILQVQAEQRNRLLDEYFESTKLLPVVQDFIANLASTYQTQLRLPANPYPDLLKSIRMHELRQAFVLQSNCSSASSLDLTTLSGQISTLPRFQVCSVEHEQFAMPIWGMKSTLEQLTGANLYSLLELVHSAFQGLANYKEFTDNDCLANVYAVLVGNSIFGAQVQALQPCFLELETHVFVSGMHLEKAMVVFARFLLKQLHETANAAACFESLPPDKAVEYHGCIGCNGITITPLSSSAVELSSEDAVPAVWSIDCVKESRVTFTNAVKTALVSNSLITINRYDSIQLSNLGGGYLCQTEQAFFFHFTMEDGNMPVESQGIKTSTSHRSFLSGSRAHASGLFFHSQGALEIAARFHIEAQMLLEKEEQNKRSQKITQVAAPITHNSVGVHRIRQRSGFVGIFQDTVDELRRIGLSNEVLREQVNCLVSCYAFNLGYLVCAHQVLESFLYRSKSLTATAVIQASFISLEYWMKRFLEESSASASTSILQPICRHLRYFYGQAKAAVLNEDERQINDFVEALRCVNELLLSVVRIVFSDFIRLVRTMTASPVAPAITNSPADMQPEISAILGEIDVLRALEMAVEERKYPPSVVSEAIFAQAIIDSCLDVALESAVMNTVAIHLPPNPFIDMSNYLQVFALRQLVWRHKLQVRTPTSITKITKPGSIRLFAMEGTNVCAVNPRLLQHVGCDQIIQTHRWLTGHHIFNEGHNKPSKSSYSVAIVPMMIILHPILFVKANRNDTQGVAPLIEVDTIEHYLVEGKEFVHARLLFVEAVLFDLRSITSLFGTTCTSSKDSSCWHFQAKARVLDPHGHVVAEYDLTPAINDVLPGILENTTQTQLLLQVVIEIAEVKTQGDNSSVEIHKVTKAYAFHYHTSDDQGMAGPSTNLSPLVCFRVSEYGVFFSKENAQLCLQSMEFATSGPQGSAIPRDEWTPYASEAYHYDDRFLIYQLGVVHNTPSCASSQEECDIELTTRLIVHSDVCQLYSMEQAIRWLLDALKVKTQQLIPSNSRKGDLSELPPPVVFLIHHRLALEIIAQVERIIVPLNHQLQFLHEISGPLAMLRKCVTRWQTVQPPTEEQLVQQQSKTKTSEVLPTPREDPIIITSELIDSLRSIWIFVLFFRFSYQRAFFVNAGSGGGKLTLT